MKQLDLYKFDELCGEHDASAERTWVRIKHCADKVQRLVDLLKQHKDEDLFQQKAFSHKVVWSKIKASSTKDIADFINIDISCEQGKAELDQFIDWHLPPVLNWGKWGVTTWTNYRDFSFGIYGRAGGLFFDAIKQSIQIPNVLLINDETELDYVDDNLYVAYFRFAIEELIAQYTKLSQLDEKYYQQLIPYIPLSCRSGFLFAEDIDRYFFAQSASTGEDDLSLANVPLLGEFTTEERGNFIKLLERAKHVPESDHSLDLCGFLKAVAIVRKACARAPFISDFGFFGDLEMTCLQKSVREHFIPLNAELNFTGMKERSTMSGWPFIVVETYRKAFRVSLEPVKAYDGTWYLKLRAGGFKHAANIIHAAKQLIDAGFAVHLPNAAHYRAILNFQALVFVPSELNTFRAEEGAKLPDGYDWEYITSFEQYQLEKHPALAAKIHYFDLASDRG